MKDPTFFIKADDVSLPDMTLIYWHEGKQVYFTAKFPYEWEPVSSWSYGDYDKFLAAINDGRLVPLLGDEDEIGYEPRRVPQVGDVWTYKNQSGKVFLGVGGKPCHARRILGIGWMPASGYDANGHYLYDQRWDLGTFVEHHDPTPFIGDYSPPKPKKPSQTQRLKNQVEELKKKLAESQSPKLYTNKHCPSYVYLERADGVYALSRTPGSGSTIWKTAFDRIDENFVPMVME